LRFFPFEEGASYQLVLHQAQVNNLRYMQRILIISDAVVPSGFAQVIRSIFQPLHKDFELHQLATRYHEGPHDYPWRLYPAGKGKSVYGYDQISSLIKTIEPDGEKP
jgi:hypothetical protein